MVVFEDGVPKKAHYRKFAMRDATGQDDFAMMNQVLRRRFERRSRRRRRGYDESFAALPGPDRHRRRQGAALGRRRGARATPAPSVDVVGLAKQREEVFVPGRRDAAAAADRRPGVAAAAAHPRRGTPLRGDVP